MDDRNIDLIEGLTKSYIKQDDCLVLVTSPMVGMSVYDYYEVDNR